MKAITISGNLEDFDRVADRYIYGRDIHLENAMSVFHDTRGLKEFKETNEYDSIVRSLTSILALADITDTGGGMADEGMTTDEIRGFIGRMEKSINNEKARDEQLKKLMEDNKKVMKSLEPLSGVDSDLSRLPTMEFVSYRFGRLPKTGYITMQTYLTDGEFVFFETSKDEKGVWGFIFTPSKQQQKIDDIFRNLYFEQVEIPSEFDGTPKQVYDILAEENKRIEAGIKDNRSRIAEIITNSREELCAVLNLAKRRRQFSEIKRKAAHTDLVFFVSGWMEKKDAQALEKEIAKEKGDVMIFVEDPDNAWAVLPPTKLRNNFVFRPFEMFVKMYGMPRYGEIDPTPILAITYILFFGIMFGDVGQSLILAIAGFLIYKIKKMDLAGIVGFVGLSGIVTGFIYGSFFGNEEIIPEIFHTAPLKPMEQIGVMLGGTIGIGMAVIIFGMVLNVVNLIKSGHKGECLFSHNGMAGIVFYLSVLCLAGDMLLGLGLPTIVFVILIIIALAVMFFEDPLSKLVEGRKNWKPESGMFFVESFFELFEVILSFFSNTISFLRIGAFAIVHVGMMTVVAVLSQGGGVGGAVVQVIGNLLVMALEGLIVGIQVLRLEYYEMFSRYFGGGGKAFVSLKDN